MGVSLSTISTGLVNILGQAISCPANSTIQSTPNIWGITYEACEAECGLDKVVQSLSFASAAVPLTTWLLPWIALIAQLPFEAGGWMDLLSAFLCVGSPVLATYSLALTAFNRRYIKNTFEQLQERVVTETKECYHYLAETLDAARFVLEESQQCPMRANQRTGEFACLIVLLDRQNFWLIAAKDLENTRRGFTYSFLAQMILAFISYLISFIAAVHDSLGSPDVGLQFASSSVWSWMFPVVFGYAALPFRSAPGFMFRLTFSYIRVGSQCKAGAIKQALVDNTIIHRCRHAVPVNAQVMYQQGLRPDAELYRPLPVRTLADLQSALPAPTWLGIDVRGDERREGPIFNYARAFTWFAFADHVRTAFRNSINEINARDPLQAINQIPPVVPIPLVTARDAAHCCGYEIPQHLGAFMSRTEIPAVAFQHIFFAAILALFLQWGTTGAAVFVAYWTPTIGLGCRSGSYLIYGIASTVSWLVLLLSQWISHGLMRRLERGPRLWRLQRSIWGALAVITWVLGTAIAVANALWLITSSVMEEIGYFQTCWCQTDTFQYHTTGWTPLFKGAADLRNEASGIWIKGFSWSITVCLVTAGILSA
ncbi:hypothetical protein C8R45DRAFT_1094892 [Mycena sanguinolenta]|nr:hypothetical protein C8R45DRAFT_1094892 [Mycena sanguinolenta]